MNVVITGSAGLMGWHMRCFLDGHEGIEVMPLDKAGFLDDQILSSALSSADAVIHLAGRNRGEPEEVAADNIAITQRLVYFLKASDATPHVVFASSTQVDKGNPYGDSKAACSTLLSAWVESAGESARFSNVIFPHLYGECGKPFYNSVVSTFCHLVATGGEPEIQVDSELNLLHCQDAAALMFQLLEEKHEGELRPEGHRIMVSEMLAELQQLAGGYRDQLLPDLTDPFRLRLFNTYRSFLSPEDRVGKLQLHSDDRGSLFEAVRSQNAGQTFFSTTKPGITRGNHYHTRKVERFLVVKGEAVIRMRKMFSDEVLEFPVNSIEPCYIDMPTLFTHNISNVGDEELMTLFWVNEIFNPEDTDTFFEEVAV